VATNFCFEKEGKKEKKGKKGNGKNREKKRKVREGIEEKRRGDNIDRRRKKTEHKKDFGFALYM
jgi:hypothetical protein